MLAVSIRIDMEAQRPRWADSWFAQNDRTSRNKVRTISGVTDYSVISLEEAPSSGRGPDVGRRTRGNGAKWKPVNRTGREDQHHRRNGPAQFEEPHANHHWDWLSEQEVLARDSEQAIWWIADSPSVRLVSGSVF